MEQEFRARANKFIAKGVQRLADTRSSLDSEMQKFQSIYKDYSEASSTYIEARRQYIAYLEKYQDTAQQSPVMASFPGISSHLPSYAPNEMINDSDKMKKLSNTILDYAKQVDILEEQLRLSLTRVAAGTNQIIKLSNQATAYLDEVIVGMDSVYDIGQLSGVLG